MEYPVQVVAYLQDEFLLRTRPFCFLVDNDYRLIDSWGDGDWCGLDRIEPGADMRGRLPISSVFRSK